MAEQPFREAETSVIAPQDTSDPGAMEELMGSLDKNNGELTFPEFWKLIGNLASKQGGFS